MIWLSIFFLIITAIAALIGFTGIAVSVAGVAKILFGFFFALSGITLFLGWRRCRVIRKNKPSEAPLGKKDWKGYPIEWP